MKLISNNALPRNLDWTYIPTSYERCTFYRYFSFVTLCYIAAVNERKGVNVEEFNLKIIFS